MLIGPVAKIPKKNNRPKQGIHHTQIGRRFLKGADTFIDSFRIFFQPNSLALVYPWMTCRQTRRLHPQSV